MFTVTGLLILLAAVVGSAAMVAVLAWIWHRVRRLEEGGGRTGSERLLREVDELREEVEAARRETRSLAEQVDFMERLLRSGEDDDGEGRGGAG